MSATVEPFGLREENRTLYRVIKLVSSSIELDPMLHGIVDLATEATDCHACFIYLLEDGVLTIRAASPVYADAVGEVRLGIEEGLTGWVAQHRTPAFIRENAMSAYAALGRGESNPLARLLADDERIVQFVDPAEVRAQLDPTSHVGDAPVRARRLSARIRTTLGVP